MDVMLDLETLALSTRPVILTIGLQAFNAKGSGLIGPGLEIQVDPQSCIDHGLDVDWSTVHWWMTKTTEEAKAGLPRPGLGCSLPMALTLAAQYMGQMGGRDFNLWSNGAAADVPWLESAYRAAKMKTPWSYNKVLDMRTMKWLVGNNVERREPTVAHNCLSDAQAQALYIQDCYQWLQLLPEGKKIGGSLGGAGAAGAEVGGKETPAEEIVEAPKADVNDRSMGGQATVFGCHHPSFVKDPNNPSGSICTQCGEKFPF